MDSQDEKTAEVEASLRELAAVPPEAKKAAMLKDNLLEKIKKEPGTAGRLIQGWMRREEVD
jgi:hypothetical protein